MRDKKVYCGHCLFYIPQSMKHTANGYLLDIEDKCCSPNAVRQRKVKDTYDKKAHTVPYFLPPKEKNAKNDCKDYTFGIHKSRMEKHKEKKSWWKFW